MPERLTGILLDIKKITEKLSVIDKMLTSIKEKENPKKEVKIKPAN